MKTLLLAGTTVAALAAVNFFPAMAQATKPVSQGGGPAPLTSRGYR